MADRRLQGRARWSHAARCNSGRMAALGLLGAEPAPLTERQRGRFQRGKDAQRYVGQQFEEKYGAANIEHERAVPWPTGNGSLPIGELHEDIYVAPDKLIIEVKSSEQVDGIFDSALLQVKGQLHFDKEAEMGALMFVDRDYQQTDMFPVVLTDDDREEIEGIAAAVVHAGKTGELPERICSRPADGIQHLCPFIGKCFEGWEPSASDEQPDLAPQATEAYLAQRDLSEAKARLKPLEERWEAAKAALDELELPPGLEVATGQLTVKRTAVSGSERMSLSKARKLGLFTEADGERFSSVISHTAGHNRYTIQRVGDEPLDQDFGDVPF